MNYQIGFHQIDITPKQGLPLSGYALNRIAVGTADPLYAKIVCFCDEVNHQATVFISYDLVAVDHLLEAAVRTKLEVAHPEWTIHLFLTATHTHTGPAGTIETRIGMKKPLTGIFGETNSALLQQISASSYLAFQAAFQNREPFRYQKSGSYLYGVAKDRNDGNKAGDTKLSSLHVQTESGRKLLLWHFSCHPTILDRHTLHYSADFPGVVAHELLEYDQVMFWNGNAGNISTRYTRKEETFSESLRLGSCIASALRLEKATQWHRLQHLDVRDYSLSLATNPASPWPMKQSQLDIVYSIIHFDDQFLISIPAEITSDVTLPIRENEDALFLGYCNGYWFYLADEACFQNETYEAQNSLLARGEAEKLIAQIGNDLTQIKNEAGM